MVVDRKESELSPVIIERLTAVRRLLLRYLLILAVCWLLISGLLFLWGTLALDLGYFWLTRLELPREVRLLCWLGWSALFLIWSWRFARSVHLKRLGPAAWALLVERQHPEWEEEVITAAEMLESRWQSATAVERLLALHTLEKAVAKLQSWRPNSLFNPRPLKNASNLLVGLVLSVLGLIVFAPDVWGHWWAGFVHLDDDYWVRRTQLELFLLTQPGDRLQPFLGGVARHPKGADLRLIVRPKAGTVKPERITLTYKLSNGTRRRVYLSASPGQDFQLSVDALLDNLECWVRGGDYAHRLPWRVEVVDPPQLDRLIAIVQYPDYTGLNPSENAHEPAGTYLDVTGTQLSLPLGSALRLQGKASKPLRALRIVSEVGSDRFEWYLECPSNQKAQQAVGWLMWQSREQGKTLRSVWEAQHLDQLWSSDGRQFECYLQLLPNGLQQIKEILATNHLASTDAPLPWPAESLWRIYLEDPLGIVSAEPHRVLLTAIPDQAPEVEVQLTGVSQSVTRLARIPIAGVIRDDYGITAARFEYKVGENPESTTWQQREFASVPPLPVREWMLMRSADEPYERFDLLPLELSPKQKLVLTVVAEDGDPFTGPHQQRSQHFVFTIVTAEELLTLLYARELNLRRRFEQIMNEVRDYQREVREVVTHVASASQPSSELNRPELPRTPGLIVDKGLHGLRKNAAETEEVRQAFQAIRQELVNNGAETPQNLQRLDDRIIKPLDTIIRSDFVELDQRLGELQVLLTRQVDPHEPLAEVELRLIALLERMERVLLEMRKLETFHEAMELLKSIIAEQDAIKEETKTERKRRALRALE